VRASHWMMPRTALMGAVADPGAVEAGAGSGVTIGVACVISTDRLGHCGYAVEVAEEAEAEAEAGDGGGGRKPSASCLSRATIWPRCSLSRISYSYRAQTVAVAAELA
jgi:hypothetical protein